MPRNYNPVTDQVETLEERYQRETLLEKILYQQYIDEKIDNLKDRIKGEDDDKACLRPE